MVVRLQQEGNHYVMQGDRKDINEYLDNIQKEAYLNGKVIKKPSHQDAPLVKWQLEDAHFMIEFPKLMVPEVEKFFRKYRNYQQTIHDIHNLEKVYKISLADRIMQIESTQNKMLHTYFDCLIDQVNDHKDADMDLGHGVRITPLKVAYRDDLLTLIGIYLCNKNIALEGSTVWNTGAVGIGFAPAAIWSDSLDNEISDTDVTHGFFTSSGLSILYGFMFGETLGDNVFREGLVRNQTSPSGAKVLCKQTFNNDPIDHVQNNAGFAIAGILEYAPVIDPFISQ